MSSPNTNYMAKKTCRSAQRSTSQYIRECARLFDTKESHPIPPNYFASVYHRLNSLNNRNETIESVIPVGVGQHIDTSEQVSKVVIDKLDRPNCNSSLADGKFHYECIQHTTSDGTSARENVVHVGDPHCSIESGKSRSSESPIGHTIKLGQKNDECLDNDDYNSKCKANAECLEKDNETVSHSSGRVMNDDVSIDMHQVCDDKIIYYSPCIDILSDIVAHL